MRKSFCLVNTLSYFEEYYKNFVNVFLITAGVGRQGHLGIFYNSIIYRRHREISHNDISTISAMSHPLTEL